MLLLLLTMMKAMCVSLTELPDQRPQVVVELANTVAYEGTVGRFRCKFHGQPEPQVKWYQLHLHSVLFYTE